MDPEPSQTNSIFDYGTRPIAWGRRLIVTYTWVIFKNVIGWLLILMSGPVGLAVPGPGGLPLFLIGFAMISFPGKRKLTARVIRGKPIPADSASYKWGSLAVALIAPLGVVIYIYVYRKDPWLAPILSFLAAERLNWVYTAGYVVLTAALWLLLWPGRWILNKALSLVPKIRRKVRPWLRRNGVDLLPARRRRRRMTADGPFDNTPDHEILAIHERHYKSASVIWKRSKPWLRRVLAVVAAVAIFYWIIKPIQQQWPTVREQILETNPLRFLIAVLMFAAFLFFRAISWRRILIGLGHRLPMAPAVRIWSTSELARYLPGAIWQVMGRIYLVRPYGVSGSVSSTSQVLELTVFMLANVILAAACYLYFGLKVSDDARIWLYFCCLLLPALAIFVHPKIFYGIVNKVLSKLRKPMLAKRLDGFALSRLLGRMLLALLWQNAAVFILVQPALGLKLDHWWTVAGAYCLAWCVGFAGGFLVPAGIGVREFVFVAGMRVVLPQEVATRLDGPQSAALLGFLAILLRLWTVLGELILTAIAHSWDYKGALNLRGASGRKEAHTTPVA